MAGSFHPFVAIWLFGERDFSFQKIVAQVWTDSFGFFVVFLLLSSVSAMLLYRRDLRGDRS